MRFQLRPLPSLLLAMLSVQCGAAFAKRLFPIAGPLWTGALRICFSALMLALIFRPRLTHLRREQWQAAIPYGIALGGMNLCFYFALERIPLGLAVAVEFTGPLLVALLGSQRLLDFLWAVLAIVGILLVTPWSASHNANAAGVGLALCAGLLWAAYILLGYRVSQVFSGSTGVAVGMIAAALAVLPAVVFSPASMHFEPRILLTGFGVAALSSALPYTLEMVALRAIPARTFGILMSLEPAVAAACGWMLLGERLYPAQCFAIVLVMMASAGTSMAARRIDSPIEI
ncbi:MAG: DMT family transporter [Acidobacteriaceae bacterium]|nr:DMT family transporter [Acidobacteriaceae bacterium]